MALRTIQGPLANDTNELDLLNIIYNNGKQYFVAIDAYTADRSGVAKWRFKVEDIINGAVYELQLPTKRGTLAVTSDLANYQPLDADLTAIAGLTGTSGFLKKTDTNTWTLDTTSDTWRTIKVNGTQLLGSGTSTGAINFKNGSNITITGSGNDITISTNITPTEASFLRTINGGSGSLKAYDATTGGAAKVSSGRIPFITSISNTGASASGTAKAGSETHTHNVTVSGTTGNNSGNAVAAVTGYPNFSGGGASGAYLHFSYTSAKSGGTSSAAPGNHTHTVTVSGTTGNNSGDAVAAVTGISGGSGSLSGARSTSGSGTSARRILTISHTHTGASVSSTANAAPHTHTHNYGSSTALTTSENSGTNFNAVTSVTTGSASLVSNSTSSGGIYYISGHTNASLGSPSTSNAAPHTHTHSYGSSTALATGGPSNTTSFVTGVTGGTTTATTWYLDHTHTGASAAQTDNALTGLGD